MLKKANTSNLEFSENQWNDAEQKIIIHLDGFQEVIEKSAKELNPSLIANYVFELVKLYNSFYQNTQIIKEENISLQHQRLALSNLVKNTIKNSLSLLGVESPNQM